MDVFPILPTLLPIKAPWFKYLLSAEDSQIRICGLSLSDGLEMYIVMCLTIFCDRDAEKLMSYAELLFSPNVASLNPYQSRATLPFQ